MGGLGEVEVKMCPVVRLEIHAQLFGRKVNLKILKMGRLRLGRVKVTWCVGGWLSSDKRYSQRVKPEFPM